jgi:hypothetical protein
MNTPIELTHRTVFDYLHTPEMQVLLSEHTPNHFEDIQFPNDLSIAACKMAVIDPLELYGSLDGLRNLCRCGRLSFRWADYSDNLKTEKFENGMYSHLELAQGLEEVALYHLTALRWFSEMRRMEPMEGKELKLKCKWLSIDLAIFGLFTYTDTLVAVAPHLISSTSLESGLEAYMSGILLETGQYDKVFDVTKLRGLLQAGVDPNIKSEARGSPWIRSTPWEMFLGQLTKNSWVFLPHTRHVIAASGYGLPKDPSDTRVIATQQDVYANPYIQDAIKTFIEFGAELKPKTVEKLTRFLPKFDGNNFDWPEFLTPYFQPAKRIELDDNRRERLRRWPESLLSDEDRKLLHSSSCAVEEMVE